MLSSALCPVGHFSCWRRVQSYLGGPTLLSLFLALLLDLSSIDRSVDAALAAALWEAAEGAERLFRLVLLSAICDPCDTSFCLRRICATLEGAPFVTWSLRATG